MLRLAVITGLGLAVSLQATGRTLDAAQGVADPEGAPRGSQTTGSSPPPAAGPVLDRVLALFDRGHAQLLDGAFRDAVDSFDRALRLAPGHRDAHFYRGIAAFSAGDDAAAISDFERAVARVPSDAYRVAWAYLASAQREPQAHRVLETRVQRLDLDVWPGPLLRWYLGRGTLSQVVEAVRDADLDRQVAKTCEAGYFVGRKLQLDGHVPEAVRWFATAMATCENSRMEFALARAALKNRAPDAPSVAAQSAPRTGQTDPAAVAANADEASTGTGIVSRTALKNRAPDEKSVAAHSAPRTGQTDTAAVAPNADKASTGEASTGIVSRAALKDGAPDAPSVAAQSAPRTGRTDPAAVAPNPDAASTGIEPRGRQPDAPATAGRVTTTDVNYRSGPGLEYRRLGTFARNTPLRVEASVGDWLRIRLDDGSQAFLSARFTRTVFDAGREAGDDAEQRYVATTRARLRAGPGLEHEIVRVVGEGTELSVTGTTGAWLQVRFEGAGQAYVHETLLRRLIPARKAPAEPPPDVARGTGAPPGP